MIFLFLAFIGISCWKYRTDLEIYNSLGDTNDTDVLIVLDTEQLILDGKLNENCTDIEFVVLPRTILPHYIESGCNKRQTHFWITFDTLLDGTTFMYAFYGGDSMNFEGTYENFDGFYYSMMHSDCRDEWDQYDDAYERFIRIDSAAVGEIGGSKDHTHPITDGTQFTSTGITVGDNEGKLKTDPLWAFVTISKEDHDHELLIKPDTISDLLPPYYSIKVCKSNDFIIYDNFIGLFDDVQASSASPDFSQQTGINERLPCYSCNIDVVGDSGGDNDHTHELDIETFEDCPISIVDPPDCFWEIECLQTSSRKHSINDHYHLVDPGFDNTSSIASTFPRYYSLYFSMYSNAVDWCLSTPNLMTIASDKPPKGFDYFDAADGYFLRGAPTGNEIDDTFDDTEHSHTTSGTFLSSYRYVITSTPGTVALSADIDHYHTFDAHTEDSDWVPEYINFALIKRKESVDHFVGNETFLCWGIAPGEPDECSNHGECVAPNDCNCTSTNYYGEMCQDWGCYQLFRNHSDVCSGHGDCINHNDCLCDEGYYDQQCDQWNCSGIAYDDNTVCDSKGNCSSPQICDCDDDRYFGPTCTNWYCGLFLNNENDVCSGHGNCSDIDYCVCDVGYFEQYCSGWNCSGLHWNDQKVCNKLGNCTESEHCECENGYFGQYCDMWTCNQILKNLSSVCNTHGNCTAYEVCECETGYLGKYCGGWTCYDYDRNDTEACSQHGDCCDCDAHPGYYGYECQYWDCYGVEHGNVGVCSTVGNCLSPDNCQCLQDVCTPLDTCIYGENCGEKIWTGLWKQKKKIEISYMYEGILDHVLLNRIENEDGEEDITNREMNAYFLCSDIIENVEILGDYEDEKNCFFTVVGPHSTKLNLKLENNHQVEDESQIDIIILTQLDEIQRDMRAHITVYKKWKDEPIGLVIPPEVGLVTLIVAGLFLVVLIVLIILAIICLVLIIKMKPATKQKVDSDEESESEESEPEARLEEQKEEKSFEEKYKEIEMKEMENEEEEKPAPPAKKPAPPAKKPAPPAKKPVAPLDAEETESESESESESEDE